ncbi:unnamed protein product [Blepharisma stoltei]|uniref:Uncharacterized protein n=1 Tax=Blepharisma stoltei TaxID=1481888 RepID=A0AAU9KDH7_9CILI|nr:unnamed protein product [Blepharisma stoltei]
MLQDQNIRDYQESKEETLIGRQKIDYLKGLILIEKEKLIKQNTSQEDLVNAPQIRLSELQQELIKEFENEIKKAFKDQKNLNSYLQQMQREVQP